MNFKINEEWARIFLVFFAMLFMAYIYTKEEKVIIKEVVVKEEPAEVKESLSNIHY